MLRHLADGVSSTVAWIAALSVYAGLLVGTVLVALAARLPRRHHLTASSTGIGHLVLGTLTNHCSYWNAI